jgi:hypothetical protein
MAAHLQEAAIVAAILADEETKIVSTAVFMLP